MIRPDPLGLQQVPVITDDARFFSTLKIGDIVNTLSVGSYGSIVSRLSRFLNGDPFTHSSLYIGNKKVIHATSSRGVVIDSLEKVLPRIVCIILRPTVGAKLRKTAVARAKAFLGTEYSYTTAAAAAVSTAKERVGKYVRSLLVGESVDATTPLICSSMIARAYGIRFSSRDIGVTTPGDIFRSQYVRKVAIWVPIDPSEYER